MNTPEKPLGRRTRASDAIRDRVVTELSDALTRGQLSTVEFDERQSQAIRAQYIDELPTLIEDIPEAGELEAELVQLDQQRRGHTGSHPAVTSGTGSLAHTGAIQPTKPGTGMSDTVVAVLGGSNKVVQPGTPTINGFSLLGSSELDLVDVMGPGVELTIDTVALLGGNNLHVPPGVRIIDETIYILGGNDVEPSANGDGSNGTLVIKGFNLMGGISIKLARGYRSRR